MSEAWAGTTAGDALSRRIEALAAQASTESRVEQELLAAVAEVRREVGEMRAAVEDQALPMEARLAALEDTLDGVAERLEAFARDGASTTAERLSVIARDVATVSSALATRTDELREFVADRTADSAATLLDAAAQGDDQVVTRLGESIAGLAGSVRDAIDTFAGSVERSLTALGTSVGGALAEARDSHDDHLDEVGTNIEDRIDRLVGEQQQAQAALVDQLRGAATELREQGARTASDIAAQLGAQQEAADATRADVTTMLTQVRGELGEMVDGVRRQVQEELNALRADLLGAIADGTAATKTLLVENERTAAGRVAEIKRGIDVHAHELDGASKHIASLAKAAGETKTVLTRMEAGWSDVAAQVVAEAHAAAAAELDEFRNRIRTEIEALRATLRETTDSVLGARDQLNDGTGRLGMAGEALLQYLAERDHELEETRDRVLHELLDDFAQGLKPKERRGLAEMLQTSRERAAQKRDAERWRRAQAGEPPPAPVPLVVQPATGAAPDAAPAVEAPRPAEAPSEAPAEAPAGAASEAPTEAERVVETEAGASVDEQPPTPSAPEPVQPPKPATPATPVVKEAAKPLKAVPAKPAKPAKAAKPVKAVKAAKPAKPAKAVKATPPPPTEPVDEAEPAKPAEPLQPPTAAEPGKPAKATKPAKPARKATKPAAKRTRASVDTMPEAASPTVALEAAAPSPAPGAAAPAPPAPPVPGDPFAPPSADRPAAPPSGEGEGSGDGPGETHDAGSAAIDAFAAAVKPRRGLRRR